MSNQERWDEKTIKGCAEVRGWLHTREGAREIHEMVDEMVKPEEEEAKRKLFEHADRFPPAQRALFKAIYYCTNFVCNTLLTIEREIRLLGLSKGR